MKITGESWNLAADRIGLVGLYIFSFFAFLGAGGAYAGLILMLLALFMNFRSNFLSLINNRFVMLIGIFLVYLMIRTTLAVYESPDIAYLHKQEAWSWSHLGLVVLVAWWLAKDRNRISVILLLALSGFLLDILSNVDWDRLDALLRGLRTGFGMQIISFGLYCATAIMGLILCAPRLIGDIKYPVSLVLRSIFWLAALTICLQGLLTSQSKGALLSAVIMLPVVVIARIWISFKRHGSLRWKVTFVVGLAVSLLMTGILSVNNKELLKNRFLAEKQTILSLSDLENIPYSSLGYRIRSSILGLESWLSRPVLGLGPGASKSVIANSDDEKLRHLAHLHNSYVEVLVRFGLAGFVIFIVGIWWIFKSLYEASKQKLLKLDSALFVAGAFGLTLIWCLAEFRMTHIPWRFYWMLFGAIAISFAFVETQEKNPDSEDRNFETDEVY
ncbi:MAG: O-antigen ligase family protein [Gammaproteobacteria bacterium]